uniref:RNA helicase n=1 Tax=Parastrongyloides trichosuri TaxID=131310 RepID=A0A0N5A211_PARTI
MHTINFLSNRLKSRIRFNCTFNQTLSTSSINYKKQYIQKEKIVDNKFINRYKSIEDIVPPLKYKSAPKKYEPQHVDGVEDLNESQISSILNEFVRRPAIRDLATENGLSEKIYMGTFKSFRKMCIAYKNLDIQMKLYLSDIHNGKASLEILFKSFLDHAKKIYPHLESIEDLKIISDLSQPHNWYPEARKIHRKIFFHAGPTNSGKTHAALERFKNAKSGVYCGPLRLLAHEVYKKTNKAGVPCDLMTGEDRRFVVDAQNPAKHCSSTVEMLSCMTPVEVAIIDEIQMLRDEQRGYAFTRALLGAPAEEIHLCGEAAAIDIVRKILDPIGEHVECIEYQRKSSLEVCNYALKNISNVQKGDAIICFSKRRVYEYVKKLNALKIPAAIIYGDLPPGVKLAQAAKFNDPNDPTKVLVATDAVGMGLNLNIGRIIFAQLTKGISGELIPTYAALQIAGRAGRYGTAFSDGKVLALYEKDVRLLNDILKKPIEPIEKTGLAPTFEQIETFSYHLPNASFVNILDIFVSVCSINETYFLCDIEPIRNLAVLIDPIDLPLNVKYGFCLAPFKPANAFLSSSFIKMARRFSQRQPITHQWLHDLIQYPFKPIRTTNDLNTVTDMYEIIETYLWLSYRFPDMFPDYLEVKELEVEADAHLQEAISRLSN